MGTICKKEVPEVQDLRERRRAGAERQHRRERIELGVHPLGEQILRELWFHDLETPVHQLETLVHSVHGAADVTGTLLCDEIVEKGKGFHLASRCVEEGRAEDVHALDVDGRFADTPRGSCRRFQ